MSNFIHKKTHDIHEINAKLIEVVHKPTGAEILYLGCDDDENVFNISFRTYPNSSNGVAHVLEHIVLCGSEKFPVKDPFFAMGRRSMNTFMNALTGTDFTCYPAASQIEADFYHLLDVYLDAVFHPKLTQESFWQEGVHFEFADEKNPSSPLTLKGIVYNEMKGALSNPETRLHEDFFEILYPDLPYRFNSGGNPKYIRELTYNDLKAFHSQFYHVSQALFYFYGNIPLEKHLAFLEEHAFKGVKPIPVIPQLPQQPRFKQKIRKKAFYPIAEEEDTKEKTLLALGWLTTSILDQQDLLALQVIDLALMGTDAAPLKKEILQSNLCKQVDSSLDDELSEVPYIITCKGCNEGAAVQLEELIYKTLETLAKEGIPEHLIEGALHQVEIGRKEISGHSFPYGLSLFFRSGLLKQHGGDPSDGLKIHTLFKELRKQFAKKEYIPSLLRRYFLENPHFVNLTMQPDPTLGKKELEEEAKFIKQKEAQKDQEEILKNTKRLLKYQDEEGDLELLPRLKLNEVPKIAKDYPLIEEKKEALTIFDHECFTNELLYSSLFFPLPDIKESDFANLRLFTLFASELGCGGRNYQENLDYIFQYTGGVGCELDLFISAENPTIMLPSFSIRGKSLRRNIDKLFSLFKEMLFSIDFRDEKRLDELLKQHLEGLENSIQRSPLRYAVNLATAGLSPPCRLQYLWYGLDYVSKVKEIVKDFAKNPSSFIQKMEDLQDIVLNLQQGDLVQSVTEEMAKELKQEDFFGLSREMKGKPFYPLQQDKILPEKIRSQGRIIASPVAFTALAFPGLPYNHPLTPALSVAAELMENKTLHKRIREQGGAYGGGASHSSSWGYFYFYAYRDPHLKLTVDAFHEAAQELAALHFDDRELEEAKMGVLQSLDTPNPPESRALIGYTWLKSGRTKQMRQKWRERLINLTKEDVQKGAKEVILKGLNEGVLVSFAGKELLTKDNLVPVYPI